jgi:hypothetical protein
MRSYSMVVVVIAALLANQGCSRDPDTESRRIDSHASVVPESIRPALAMAARYGIGDDGDRADAIEAATESELEEFRRVVARYRPDIDRWLDSFGEGDNMPPEAVALMYMMLAHEELNL